MNISFSGKHAIVTGAGRGIGRDVALKLAQCGAVVTAVSKTQTNLDSLKAEHANIRTIAVDLSNWSATKDALKDVGHVDLLVNNCGWNNPEPFLEVSEKNYDMIFDTNMKSSFVVSQCVLPGMVSRGVGGSIVNVSSQASQRFLTDHIVYSTSKAAMEQFTKSLAAEFGKHKVRVNCVSPTVVMTELGRRDWSAEAKAKPMLARIPLGRFAEIDEVTDTILYLLSDRSAMVTGAVLPVDGGFWTT